MNDGRTQQPLAEGHRPLNEWSVPQRLWRALAKDPARVLVEDHGRAWTCAEMLARAEGVRRRLSSVGVGDGDVVGLDLPRSGEYIAAWLGVWFHGAAILPLAPGLPAERRAHMLSTARAVFCLGATDLHELPTQDDTTPKVLGFGSRPSPSRQATPALSVQAAQAPPGPSQPDSVADTAAPPGPSRPDTLAYVIYTSGSSGTPKGVRVSHRGLGALADAQIVAFALHERARVLWMLSTAFDAHLSDLMTTVLSGATLVIDEAGSFPERLQRGRITHVDAPPVLLRLHGPKEMPSSLETVVVGGEASPPEVLRSWAKQCRVVSVYGPTEASICTSLRVCDDAWQCALLGRPLPGVTYAVIDRNGRRASEGELWIAGDGLALGYVDASQDERFVQREGTRWYRSGDRVRCVGDDFEFLGRIDRQVQINGVRVEPAEVEAALMSHAGVTEAAVIEREIGPARRRMLVAMVAPDTVDVAALRRDVEAQLPSWMCPARYEARAVLPRGASGKIDFAALSTESTLDEPTQEDPLTAELASMWREVLGVAIDPARADFSELGGDSLAVVELAVLAESRGVALSPALVRSHSSFQAQLSALRSGDAQDVRAAVELEADARAVAASVLADIGATKEVPAAQAGAACRSETRKARPPAWFVTGATGTVGSHLLAELMRLGAAPIACLVRAGSEAQGRARLQRALDATGARLNAASLRIVLGDITRPRFGLGAEQYAHLARESDQVLHSAGVVNIVEGYARLRRANLDGAAEVARLCLAQRRKAMHFISTLSVFVATDCGAGVLREDDDASGVGWVRGGYAQSKWAAERMLRHLSPWLPLHVYRLGLITPHSVSGRGAATEQLSMLVRGLAALGAVPAGHGDLAFDWTPVDLATQILARLLLRPRPIPGTFHVANSQSATLGLLVETMNHAGVRLRAVDSAEWRGLAARAYRERDTALAYASLCRALGDSTHRSMDLFQATGAEFCTKRTQREVPYALTPPSVERLLPMVRAALEPSS
ncbi:MAG: thioester reductase domain-containing protein [Polyangiaceae bacterium]